MNKFSLRFRRAFTLFSAVMFGSCSLVSYSASDAFAQRRAGQQRSSIASQRDDKQEGNRPQERAEPRAEDEGATIRGTIKQSKYRGFEIDMTELGEIAKLTQRIQLPKPPFPPKWGEWNMEQRLKWIEEFEKTDQGKALTAEVQKITEAQQVFSLRIEPDGKFVIYDVPNGVYDLFGRINQEKDGRNFAFEVFGSEVKINSQVHEIVLDDIQVLVTPLLAVGEMTPRFEVKTYDDKATLIPRQFVGKYLFVNFWSLESKPSTDFQPEIMKMMEELKAKGHDVHVLSICVDKDRDKAIDHMRKTGVAKGSHGFTDGWEHPTLEGFGVRAIPSYWLLDPEAKIKMTHVEFQRAFFGGGKSLSDVVEARILGTDAPTLAPTGEGTESGGAQDDGAQEGGAPASGQSPTAAPARQGG